MPTLFAFGPQDLQSFAVPIGIALAVVIILVVPSLRRAVIGSFTQGRDAGERMRGKMNGGGNAGQRGG
jgi:hypothetical protein